jgi:cell division protein FtsB
VTKTTAAPPKADSFRPVLGAAVVLFLALLLVAGVKSWRDLEAARSRERALTDRIEALHRESERLKARIERLRHDPGTLERLAREELGMVRPGDVLFELPQKPPEAKAK